MKIKNEYHRIQNTHYRKKFSATFVQAALANETLDYAVLALRNRVSGYYKGTFQQSSKAWMFLIFLKIFVQKLIGYWLPTLNHEFKFTKFVEKIAGKTSFVENKIEFHQKFEFRRFLYTRISFKTHKKPALPTYFVNIVSLANVNYWSERLFSPVRLASEPIF